MLGVRRVGEAKAQEIVTEAARCWYTYAQVSWKTILSLVNGLLQDQTLMHRQAHRMAKQVRDNAMGDVDEIWGSES